MVGKVRMEIDYDTRELIRGCVRKDDTYDSILRYMVKLYHSYKETYPDRVE